MNKKLRKEKISKKNAQKNQYSQHITGYSNGITLVALIITIIVLLILVAVTIRAVTGDGIISHARNASNQYIEASEKEAIGMSILEYNLGQHLDAEAGRLGQTLYDRNLENSSKWNIIVSNSNNTTYGTNWNYIPKGTNVEGYGNVQNSWVVNYETGEIIKLEEGGYEELSYEKTLAVKDPLFNLDSANVSLDISSFGNNATLYYYDAEQYSTTDARIAAYEEEKDKTVESYKGYDRQVSNNVKDYIDEKTNAFQFNGNNYIEIKNPNGFDFTEGITFEFYGNISGNVAATVPYEENTRWDNLWCGLLGLWDGKYNSQCNTRFGCLPYPDNAFWYSLEMSSEQGKYGEWSHATAPWNQAKEIGDIFNKNIYLTLTIKPSATGDEDAVQSIYIYMDNQKVAYSGWLAKEYYNDFVTRAKKLNYLELGRCTWSSVSNWSYIKGLCYATRIYNRALTEEQVQANYDATTQYHEYVK